MDWILEHWDDVLIIISGIISVASVIVKVTPTQKDDEVLGKIMKVLEFLSLKKKI